MHDGSDTPRKTNLPHPQIWSNIKMEMDIV